MLDLRLLADAIVDGDGNDLVRLTTEALAEGIAPQTIIEAGLMPGMDEVGQRFSALELFVPDLLVSANAMRRALEVLRPHLPAAEQTAGATIILGTVAGDVHDIGKNLVGMMLEGAGFTIVDLGVNVSAQSFVEAVARHRPAILGLSALLTTTMPGMVKVMQALQAAGLRDSVMVMAGGAPVSERFAQSIGADGYARDAAAAVDKARELAGLVPAQKASA